MSLDSSNRPFTHNYPHCVSYFVRSCTSFTPPLHLSPTSAALRQKSSLGGSVQVGERHISMERCSTAAGRPVSASAEAGGRGIRRLQLIQGGSLIQAGFSERHRGRPAGEENQQSRSSDDAVTLWASSLCEAFKSSYNREKYGWF